MESVESQIKEWRAYVAGAPGVNGRDVDELEDHLRGQIAELNEAGLADDEAFLVAVKRMGDVDSLSREFAREHSGRLWKQLVLSGGDEPTRAMGGWLEAFLFGLGRRRGAPDRAPRGRLPRRGAEMVLRGTSASSCCRSSPATSRAGGSSTCAAGC